MLFPSFLQTYGFEAIFLPLPTAIFSAIGKRILRKWSLAAIIEETN